MKQQFLDIFSGGGGASLGLKAAGFETIGIDSDLDAVKFYRRNVGYCIASDISFLAPEEFIGITGIFASPPCQQWSSMRDRNLGTRQDAEIGRVLRDWILVLRPRYFILENVPGYRRSLSFAVLLLQLLECGYSLRWQVIDLSKYGIPQSRQRLFLWAVRDAIAPSLTATSPHKGWWSHIKDLALPSSNLTMRQYQALFAAISLGNLRGTAAVAIERCGTRSDRPPIIRRAEDPIHTLRVGNCNRPTSINCVAFAGNSMLIRTLNREALARLQTFPDGYIWSGFHETDGRILGNSVPPAFAETLIRHLCHDQQPRRHKSASSRMPVLTAASC